MPKSAEQPKKFFNEAMACLTHLRGIPVVAIDALRNDEATRDVIISILRTCYRICQEAGVDIEEEIYKQETRTSAENNLKNNLKEMMRDDRVISMDELKNSGLKLHFTENGPVVVPA